MNTTFRLADFGTQQLMRFEEIVCLIGDRNYTHIWLSNGSCIIASRTLDLLGQLLNPDFVCIHKRHAINRAFINQYIQGAIAAT